MALGLLAKHPCPRPPPAALTNKKQALRQRQTRPVRLTQATRRVGQALEQLSVRPLACADVALGVPCH